MAVDPDIQTNILGIKAATAVAGFLGGVICLSWLRELTRTQAAMAVITGSVTASYGTPALMWYLNWPLPLENAAAFFMGLTAMNIIPGLIRLSELFKRDPAGWIGRDGGDK